MCLCVRKTENIQYLEQEQACSFVSICKLKQRIIKNAPRLSRLNNAGVAAPWEPIYSKANEKAIKFLENIHAILSMVEPAK